MQVWFLNSFLQHSLRCTVETDGGGVVVAYVVNLATRLSLVPTLFPSRKEDGQVQVSTSPP